MKIKISCVIALFILHTNANAQDSISTTEEPVQLKIVEVSGIKNQEFKPYQQMLKGIDAFEKYHALAPLALLKFQLIATTKEAALKKVVLTLSGPNTQVSLPIDIDGTFTIPKMQSAADDNAEIVSNIAKGMLRWRSEIRTPNIPSNSRRLGDLRLECEIGWAIGREDMSFLARNSLSAIGGLCHSKMVGLRHQAPYPLNSVKLVSGERTLELSIDPELKSVYWPPLADASWDNDSLIVYEYASIDKK